MHLPRRAAFATAFAAALVVSGATVPFAVAVPAATETSAVAITQLLRVYPLTVGSVGFEVMPEVSPGGPWPIGFDVRISHTSMLKAAMSPWAYPAALQGKELGSQFSIAFGAHVGRGRVVCASSRPRFADGVLGQWGSKFCTGRFLDDNALTRHGKTRRVANKHYWGGYASEVARDGSLRLRHVPGGSQILTLSTHAASPDGRCTCAWLVFPKVKGTGEHLLGSGTNKKTYYSQEDYWFGKTGRRGAVIFRPSASSDWTNPIEGILVYPGWTRT